MIFFKIKQKLCDSCKSIKTAKQIKSVEEYLAILENIKALLLSEKYELFACNHPIDVLKDEKGFWVDDGIWHTIKCKTCGTLFTCSFDTYHSFGSFRKGK